MMSSNRHFRQYTTLLPCLLLFCWLFPLMSRENISPQIKQNRVCLEITNFHSQEQLGWWVLPEPYFALSFIHSVSETPVVDFYRLDKHNNTVTITQTGERFEHHGAGLPSHVSEGTNWQHRDGYFWLSMQRPIPQLIVRTDKDYKNRLYLGKQIDAIDDNLVFHIDLNQWQDGALWIQAINCPE